jgi:hypothetical protein
MNGQRAPRFHAAGYTVLRGDNDGRLTDATVRGRRWRIAPGSRQVIALIGVRSYDASVPGHLGRVMVDADVTDCHFQGAGGLAERLAAEAAQAAEDYLRSVPR